MSVCRRSRIRTDINFGRPAVIFGAAPRCCHLMVYGRLAGGTGYSPARTASFFNRLPQSRAVGKRVTLGSDLFLVGGSCPRFPALSLWRRAVLERRIEPDYFGSIGVPKRQAGGLRSGVRIVSTFDNTDNWTPTPPTRLRRFERFSHIRRKGMENGSTWTSTAAGHNGSLKKTGSRPAYLPSEKSRTGT